MLVEVSTRGNRKQVTSGCSRRRVVLNLPIAYLISGAPVPSLNARIIKSSFSYRSVMFLLFQIRLVIRIQVAYSPVAWLIFLFSSASARTFSVFHPNRSSRMWHLRIIIMAEISPKDQKPCLSMVRESRQKVPNLKSANDGIVFSY